MNKKIAGISLVIVILCSIISFSSAENIKYSKIPNHPPHIPEVWGMTEGQPKEYLFFSAIGNDPDGDRVQVMFDWGDGTYSDWTDLLPSGSDHWEIHAWDSSGVYYVRARARDEAGLMSEWSLPLEVVISYPPLQPTTPKGPTTGYVNTLYSYSTRTIDPDGDRIFYLFDWGDGNSPEETDIVESGNTVNLSHSWDMPGTYRVKTSAVDIYGFVSEWSSPLTVTILSHPPEKPTINGPTSGEAGKSYTYTAVSTDPDGDKIFYCFNWGDGNEICTDLYASGQQASASHTWESKGDYTITVKATDEHGAESEPATLKVSMPIYLELEGFTWFRIFLGIAPLLCGPTLWFLLESNSCWMGELPPQYLNKG